ncbi:hypothetical protein PMIN03_007843 [Paraphaeosphaeria minitans]|uniref:Uncharacterized protein n=1 Tax=Paraphaeosphaeria minitans TaxID=565426 RepID=A0A9P6GLY3_9PLEO|nr:hypothetical protein PMIN01_04569 [Paraphaeosphaeria minitans]
MNPNDEPKTEDSTPTISPTMATTQQTASTPSLPPKFSDTSSQRGPSNTLSASSPGLRMHNPTLPHPHPHPPTPRDQPIADSSSCGEGDELESDGVRRPRRASDVILHADLRDTGVLGALLRDMYEKGVEEEKKVRVLVEAMEGREEGRERAEVEAELKAEAEAEAGAAGGQHEGTV